MPASLRSLFVARTGAELKPLLAALARGGFEPWWDWDRAETERELAAALELGAYDVLVYAEDATLPLARVRALVDAHAPDLPVVVSRSFETIAAEVREALGLDPR